MSAKLLSNTLGYTFIIQLKDNYSQRGVKMCQFKVSAETFLNLNPLSFTTRKPLTNRLNYGIITFCFWRKNTDDGFKPEWIGKTTILKYVVLSFVTFHCQRPFAMKVRLTIQRKTSNTQKIKSTNHACEILGEKVGFFFF